MQPLIDLATEAITQIDEASDIPAIADILLYLATHRIPIRREGTERLMDALFASQPSSPLLIHPVLYQTALQDRLTAVATPAFMAYWTHIMIPAWNHHATIHQLLRETAE